QRQQPGAAPALPGVPRASGRRAGVERRRDRRLVPPGRLDRAGRRRVSQPRRRGAGPAHAPTWSAAARGPLRGPAEGSPAARHRSAAAPEPNAAPAQRPESGVTPEQFLDGARDAFARRAWREARSAYAAVHDRASFTLDDLERHAIAAHLVGE